MGVFKLEMNQRLLDCSYCHLPLRPGTVPAEAAYTVGEMQSSLKPKAHRPPQFTGHDSIAPPTPARFSCSAIPALPPPPPPRRCSSSTSAPRRWSSSPEMDVFKLKMNQGLLDCSYCHLPLRPHAPGARPFTRVGDRIYCGLCIGGHIKKRVASGSSDTIYCSLLEDTVAQIKMKCDCDKYIPYCKFLKHQRECSSAKSSARLTRRKCMLKRSRLVCSECELPLRPPLFRHCFLRLLICSDCYRGDNATYRHCADLEYLVQGMTVKCVACKECLPFSTLASHQLDGCRFKHKLQNKKIAPDPSARKKFCDEEETESSTAGNNIIEDLDEMETERSTAGNNSIHGKNKRKAPFEVGEMDKHIVHSDEVWNDNDSSDDNHPLNFFQNMNEDQFSCEDDSIDEVDEEEQWRIQHWGAREAPPSASKAQPVIIVHALRACRDTGCPARNNSNSNRCYNFQTPVSNHFQPTKPDTRKRVAENAIKIPACDKRAEIAASSRQKTGERRSTGKRRKGNG